MTNYNATAMAQEIASRLRGQIARYDINQSALAVLCDVSQSQFSKIIRGTRPMTIDQLAVLCDAMDIDAGALLSEVEHFLSQRDRASSPLVFVEEQARLLRPLERRDDFLDAWGVEALQRLQPKIVALPPRNVRPIPQDDLKAVASERTDDTDETDEGYE